jgi:hypothetical protein
MHCFECGFHLCIACLAARSVLAWKYELKVNYCLLEGTNQSIQMNTLNYILYEWLGRRDYLKSVGPLPQIK